jgi:hypothetical protein
MDRVKVFFGGITTGRAPVDGELFQRVNARERGGVMEGARPRAETGHALKMVFNYVFVHRGPDFENWIGALQLNDFTTFLVDIREGDPGDLPRSIGTVPGNALLEQSGRLLVAVGRDDLYYSLFREGAYSPMKVFPALPPVGIRVQDSFVEYSKKKGNEITLKEIDMVNNAWTWQNTIDATPGILSRVVDQAFERSKLDEYKGRALFYDMFYLRYAFRLFDDSLVRFSPPVLVCTNDRARLSPFTGSYNTATFTPNVYLWKGNSGSSSNSNVLLGILLGGTLETTLLGKYLDNISKTRGGDAWEWEVLAERDDDSYIDCRFFNVMLEYDLNWADAGEWKHLIKSVDVFISPRVGVFSRGGGCVFYPPNRGKSYWSGELANGELGNSDQFVYASGDEICNPENVSNFYFLYSLPLGTSGLVSLGDKEEVREAIHGDNLLSREAMGSDKLGHAAIGASVAYTYNNRLHLGDVRYTLFNGFDARFFQWRPTENAGLWYNGYNGNSTSIDLQPGDFVVIEVEIELGDGTVRLVFSRLDASFYRDRNIGFLLFSPFVSYPDSRARRLTVYKEHNVAWYRLMSVPLKAHPLLDVAFAANWEKGDNTFKPYGSVYPFPAVKWRPDESHEVEARENAVRVSEVNNPIAFPAMQAYAAGDGRVIRLASNVMSVSDRNYGMFPLYVFTTTGIWTLTQGEGEILYSRMVAPTSTQVAVSGVMCSTPRGIVFSTARGLMLLTREGATGQVLDLQDDAPEMFLEANARVDGLMVPAACVSFAGFLAGAREMVYDAVNNEVIIVNDAYDFCHVVDMETGRVWRSTERANRFFRNTYPALYGYGGPAWTPGRFPLVDFGRDSDEAADVTLVTRPLGFGVPDRKYLGRMIARGRLEPGDGEMAVALYGSNDGVHFRFLRGRAFSRGTIDADLGMGVKSKFRYFALVAAGKMGKEGFLSFAEALVEKAEGGDKMR